MSIRLYATALLAITAAPSMSLASSFGPADGFAGNPPFNNNCTACHFEHEVNSGDGALDLLGLPTEYTPNQTYTLSVELSDPGQQRWGFELTALDVNDVLAQGGQLVVTDAVRTQLSEDSEGTEDYLKQTIDGTYDDTFDGPVTWTFDWTAPDASLDGVTIYVAGNATNGDFSLSGDYVYTRVFDLLPAGTTPVQESTWGQVKALYSGE